MPWGHQKTEFMRYRTAKARARFWTMRTGKTKVTLDEAAFLYHIGEITGVIVIALVTFFPVTVGLIDGFNRTDRDAINLLRSMGANRWKQFVYVRLPSALPSFFTALRIGIAYAVTGAIFAEYVGAERGLGIYMAMMKNSFRTDLVLAAVAVTAFVSVCLFLLTYVAERAIIPWHSKERRSWHG